MSGGGIKKLGSVLFGKYLMLTNTAVSGCLMAAGDGAAQMIEKRRVCNIVDLDHKRMGRYFLYGLLMGPVNHGWYTLLDKFLPHVTKTMVVKKIALDQAIAGPLNIMAFFIGLSSLEGKHINKSVNEAKTNFWNVYKMDLTLWPAAQLINFFWIPKEIRMIYVCTVSFGWTTFLAYYRNLHVNSSTTATIQQKKRPFSSQQTKQVHNHRQRSHNHSQQNMSLLDMYNMIAFRNMRLIKKENSQDTETTVIERRRKVMEKIRAS